MASPPDSYPTPWHDVSSHKWAGKLAQKWTVVRDELRSQLRDADKLIQLQPDHEDGYGMRYVALMLLGRGEEAASASGKTE